MGGTGSSGKKIKDAEVNLIVVKEKNNNEAWTKESKN